MGKISVAKGLDLKNSNRWYVVANRVQAVIYKENSGHDFSFVKRLSNPSGKKTETELDSDRPGRGAASASGAQIRHALDHRFNRHERSAQHFAKRVAHFLKIAKTDDRFHDMIVAAEPHFLGLLRKEFDPQLKEHVSHEIPKELIQASDLEIREHIRRTLQA